MAKLLAAMTCDKEKRSEVKRIRDQAYTHLKEAVDEIQERPGDRGKFKMQK